MSNKILLKIHNELARLLTNLQKKDEFIKLKKIGPRKWELSEAKQVILVLKKVLVKEPVLRLPKKGKKIPFGMEVES